MNLKTPQVILIAGPNGAGKSTLAPHLLRDTFDLPEYVNADAIAVGLSGFDPEGAALQAGRVMLERLHSLAEQNKSFAFESTLASRSYAPWLTHLKQRGYKVHILFLWLRSAELALYRVKERARTGGHDVPEDVIRRRYVRGIRNLFHLYQPLADTWTIFDNSDSPNPVLVASGHGSTAIYILRTQIWDEIKGAAR